MKCLPFLLLLGLFTTATPALAQFDTATVVGTVRDNTGGIVPGATVTLTNLDTGIVAVQTSDVNGNFEFITVRIGRYKVTAELAGFATAVVEEMQVTVGARQRVDLSLSPGQLSETVEVVAQSPLLETDSSQRGTIIAAEQARELPLNGREYSSLVLLSPGVRLSPLSTGSTSTVREGSFNINGLRSTFNNYLLDGLDNNAYGTSNQGFSNQVMQPSPDAVAEFKVVTNNMSAEYGRSAGATINVATRSGTNSLRGAAWEFFRDSSLNATGFFKPVSGGKPPMSRDQFGVAAGGPIVTNKAFFFAEYEGFRQERKFVSFSSIPTPTQRQGILAVDVRNPFTGEVYPAGTPIPMTALARKVLSELPDPTGPGTSNNYSILQEFTNNTDKWSAKGDVQVSPSLSFFGRYGYRDADLVDQPPVPLPSGGDGNGLTYVTNKQFATGFTWARTPTSLIEGRLGWSRTVAGKDPLALGTPGAQEAYGITGLPTDPRVAGGLPTQTITGLSRIGRQPTNPQWQYPTMWNPKINYTWIVGRHSLKTGYEFQHVNTEVQDVNPLYGTDVYSGNFTRPAGAGASNLYSLADFMLGLRSQYSLSPILIANLRQQMHFTYIQDDFRMNDKLTLNLGLRYEYATPHWEKDNILSNWDPDTRTMIFAQDGSVEDRSTIKPDRNNFGPRLGFAYSITPKIVTRGGYGISYIHFHRAGGANILPINAPQVINAVVAQTLTTPGFRTTQEGYPAGLTDPSQFVPTRANITFMPRDYHSSYVQSYYISVQREIAKNMLLDVAYVGNQADDLLLFANYNQATPNNSAGSVPLASRRPISDWGDITYAFNGGKSRYHALQVKYEYRMRRGLMLLNSFTWSKAKDNGAGALEGSGQGNFPSPQDFHNLEADFGTSGYDQPLNNTFSFVWDLPFGRDKRWLSDVSPVVNGFLGGWTVSGVSTMASGEPVTLQYSPAAAFQVSAITQDFRGANNYRPNTNGDPYGDKNSVTNYLNRDTVTIPTDPSQPFGNSERNSVSGPWYWNIDFVAAKDFPLPVGTDTRVQFRFEVFNLLNRTNLRAPNANRSSANFGTITTAWDARQMQLGVKLIF